MKQKDYMNKGYKMTEEHKNKIKNALLGKKKSLEHVQKIAKTKIGNTNMLGKKHSKESKDKMSNSKKGMKWPAWVCEQRSIIRKGKTSAMLGKNHSDETKIKMSENHKGSKHWNWQEGITPIKRLIRNSFLYKAWIKKCFEKDNYTCRKCKQYGEELHVHHIKPFEQILKEYKIKTVTDSISCDNLWDIKNGAVLCKKCHLLFHKLHKEVNLQTFNKFIKYE